MFVCHVAYFVIFVSCIREHARSVRDPSWTRSTGLDCVSGGDRYALFAIVLTIVILVIIILVVVPVPVIVFVLSMITIQMITTTLP